MNFRLTYKKECRKPTLWGWLIILGVFLLLVFGFLRIIHGFLSVEKPVNSGVLIIDGLLPGYAYDSLESMLKEGSYELVITTGVNLDYTFYPGGNVNTAELSLEALGQKELHGAEAAMAPAFDVEKDRTYSAARAARAWLEVNRPCLTSFNIYSLGTHSRRSYVVYRKAFGYNYNIGVYSLPDKSYDARKWYRYSRGVRVVLSETLGYIYVKLFFRPSVKEINKSES